MMNQWIGGIPRCALEQQKVPIPSHPFEPTTTPSLSGNQGSKSDEFQGTCFLLFSFRRARPACHLSKTGGRLGSLPLGLDSRPTMIDTYLGPHGTIPTLWCGRVARPDA